MRGIRVLYWSTSGAAMLLCGAGAVMGNWLLAVLSFCVYAIIGIYAVVDDDESERAAERLSVAIAGGDGEWAAIEEDYAGRKMIDVPVMSADGKTWTNVKRPATKIELTDEQRKNLSIGDASL